MKNEEKLVKITIGIAVKDPVEQGQNKKTMDIWVKEQEMGNFALIHHMAVEHEAKIQSEKLAKEYITKTVFKLLNIN